jgi:N-acetylneuraminic acid mutarotase
LDFCFWKLIFAAVTELRANNWARALGVFGVLPLITAMPVIAAIGLGGWKPLAPLPGRLGVAGAFAGVSGGALLVAGGANFPDRMPWGGGEKVWHDDVFVLQQPHGAWRRAGKLPRPLAYGVSVTCEETVICVGGSDALRHHAEAFRLHWRGGKLEIETLPSLPLPLANMSGALVGNILYIAGGTEVPGEQSATNCFFAFDLGARKPQWQRREPFPGEARFLATAAAHDGMFYLVGGAAICRTADRKPSRFYLRDTLRYRPGEGWSRLTDLPRPSVAAPAPAPWINGKLLLLGGDDGSHIGFTPPETHPGFARSILAYDPSHDQWTELGTIPAPRVTTPCIQWRGIFVVPSGEVRPGVRSPEVWALENETGARENGDTAR